MNKNKEKDQQLMILDKVTNCAAKQLESERKNKSRNYIVEWFRYAEIVGKKLNKYLN